MTLCSHIFCLWRSNYLLRSSFVFIRRQQTKLPLCDILTLYHSQLPEFDLLVVDDCINSEPSSCTFVSSHTPKDSVWHLNVLLRHFLLCEYVLVEMIPCTCCWLSEMSTCTTATSEACLALKHAHSNARKSPECMHAFERSHPKTFTCWMLLLDFAPLIDLASNIQLCKHKQPTWWAEKKCRRQLRFFGFFFSISYAMRTHGQDLTANDNYGRACDTCSHFSLYLHCTHLLHAHICCAS